MSKNVILQSINFNSPNPKVHTLMNRQFALIALVLGLFAGFSLNAQDQQKLGHINADSLLQMMPETQEAQKKLQEYSKQLETDMKEMEQELESKVTEFRSNEKMMTSLARQSKTQELQDLQRRIQQFNQSAQEDLQQKQEELLSPVIEKATKAVKDVARENGYTYVFDSSPSKGVIIYAEKGDNLMPLVKEKLGL